MKEITSNQTPTFAPDPTGPSRRNQFRPRPALELLLELAKIPSAALNLEGVHRVQDQVARELKHLGFEIRRHASNKFGYGPALEAVRLGQRHRDKFITLVGHADTVFEPTVENPIYRDLGRARLNGPGVLDDKAGLVVGITALRSYLARFPQTPLSFRFISSSNEEAGSAGFHPLFKAWGAEALVILGLEPAYPDGSIICSRRGNRWYDIRIKGHEAHTGRSTGRDLNAAHEAAVKITKLMALTRFKKGVRVSVGSINGGRGIFNVICGEAHILLDTRFADGPSSVKLDKKIRRILTKSWTHSHRGGLKALTEYEITDDCPAFSAHFGSSRLSRKFKNHVYDIEKIAIEARHGGGASDVNYLAHPHVRVIDGLGAVGDGMHTRDEWVSIASIESRAEALARLLKDCETL